jgi:hypothetical protein
MAREPPNRHRRAMALERKIRSIGTKSVTYPWLRRYVVVGPYNRRFRHEAAASILARAIVSASHTAGKLREARKRNTG